MADMVCPPHHYMLDSLSYGICRKCGAERQFPGRPAASGYRAYPERRFGAPQHHYMSIAEKLQRYLAFTGDAPRLADAV